MSLQVRYFFLQFIVFLPHFGISFLLIRALFCLHLETKFRFKSGLVLDIKFVRILNLQAIALWFCNKLPISGIVEAVTIDLFKFMRNCVRFNLVVDEFVIFVIFNVIFVLFYNFHC